MYEDKKFEKLKAETLDILVGVGGLWQPFEEIAAIHLECDGSLDKDKLRIALDQLVAEGKIECVRHQGDEEYRWVDTETRSKPSDVMELIQKERRLILDLLEEVSGPDAGTEIEALIKYRIQYKIPAGERSY